MQTFYSSFFWLQLHDLIIVRVQNATLQTQAYYISVDAAVKLKHPKAPCVDLDHKLGGGTLQISILQLFLLHNPKFLQHIDNLLIFEARFQIFTHLDVCRLSSSWKKKKQKILEHA